MIARDIGEPYNNSQGIPSWSGLGVFLTATTLRPAA